MAKKARKGKVIKIFVVVLFLSFLVISLTSCTQEQRWQALEMFGLRSGRPVQPPESDYDEDAMSSIISNNSEIQNLLYNGVYLRPFRDNPSAVSYLRFYEDGTVIVVTSIGDPEQIKKWFNNDSENVSIGSYEISDNDISFSVTSEYGSIDYTGVIIENGLILSSHNNINDNEMINIEYGFYNWQ